MNDETTVNKEEGKKEEMLVTIAHEYILEKRKARRWNALFKLVFLGIFIGGFMMLYTTDGDEKAKDAKPHAALIDIRGPIFVGAQSSSDNIVKALHRAFKDKKTQGIILRINSPGGSPVQADYIYTEIRRLKKRYPKIKVYAVCVDACASAAYYIAAAADQIYANSASIVGSIGVLYNGFGFVNVMTKIGVERRLITAGKNKGFLDPFSPMKSEQKTQLKTMLSNIHQLFENRVKAGRGARLHMTDETFSGLFWTGDIAKKMGLIDAIGSAGFVAREVIKTTRVIDYTVKPSYFEKLLKEMGLSVAEGMVKSFTASQKNRIESTLAIANH